MIPAVGGSITPMSGGGVQEGGAGTTLFGLRLENFTEQMREAFIKIDETNTYTSSITEKEETSLTEKLYTKVLNGDIKSKLKITSSNGGGILAGEKGAIQEFVKYLLDNLKHNKNITGDIKIQTNTTYNDGVRAGVASSEGKHIEHNTLILSLEIPEVTVKNAAASATPTPVASGSTPAPAGPASAPATPKPATPAAPPASASGATPAAPPASGATPAAPPASGATPAAPPASGATPAAPASAPASAPAAPAAPASGTTRIPVNASATRSPS